MKEKHIRTDYRAYSITRVIYWTTDAHDGIQYIVFADDIFIKKILISEPDIYLYQIHLSKRTLSWCTS